MSIRIRRSVMAAVMACGFTALTAQASSVSLNNPILSLPSGGPGDVTTNMMTIDYTISGGIGHFVSTVGSAFSLDAYFIISGAGATELLTPTGTSTFSITSASGNFTSTNLQIIGFTNDTVGNTSNIQTFGFLFGPGTIGTGVFTSTQVDVLIHGPVSSSFNSGTPFLLNFNGTSRASDHADTFTVPLPNAASMGLIGLAILPLAIRRRSASC